MADELPSSSPRPETPPPRTTGGEFRWEPPTAAELQNLMPGYTIEKILGRGGMGAVYRGVQTNLDRPVAIKILPPGVEEEDPSFAERFKSEARLMAKLNHPAVVAVYDFGTTAAGQLYFAMEYVDGSDVSQMIAAQGRLPPDHALAITAHVCDALSAAHELGIVHRDIKPANVLLNMKGQVKVADFGLAKVEDPGQHGLTKTGYAMGTPDFVAPEALMLGTAVDGRADLYAVGVMLYQMLTGNIPRGAFKPASVLVPGLDPRFDPIILKAMQHDREERHQSAAELRRELDVILTVPLVQNNAPDNAAIPAANVAQAPGQRSVAQKPVGRAPQPKSSTDTPVRREAAPADKSVRGTSQATKSKTPLFIGLAAAAAIGIGAFVLFSGGEKVKQSSPLAPSSGTNVATAPDSAKETVRTTPSTPNEVRDEPKTAAAPAATSSARPKDQTLASSATRPPATASSPAMTTPATAPTAPSTAPGGASAMPPATTPSSNSATSNPTPPTASSPQPAPSIPELATLDEQFKKLTAERVTAPFEKDVAALNTSYLGGLDREIAKERGKGNLDGVLALEAEKKLVVDSSGTRSQGPDGLRLPTEATASPLPAEDDEATPANLKALRKIYRDTFAKHEATRAANLKALTDPLAIRLKQLESTLTQANRIEHAKTTREYREGLQSSDPGLQPEQAAASVSAPAGGSKPGATAPAARRRPAVPKDAFSDREAAEWVLSFKTGGRMVKIKPEGSGEIEVRAAAELPESKFSIIDIGLSPSDLKERESITDTEVLRLTGLKSVIRIDIIGKLSGQALHALAQIETMQDLDFDVIGGLPAAELITMTGSPLRRFNPPNLTQPEPSGLQALATMRQLEFLDLTSQSNSELLQHLPALPKLRILYLNMDKKLQDEDLRIIPSKFPGLQRLDTKSCSAIRGTTLGVLKGMKDLDDVVLNDTQVDDAALAQLAEMKSLVSLSLHGTKVTDACISTLKTIKKLEFVNISITQITDAGLLQLAEMRQFKRLQAKVEEDGRNAVFTSAGLDAFQKARPDVTLTR